MPSLPPPLQTELESHFGSAVQATSLIGGGYISQAVRVQLKNGPDLFVKWHTQPAPQMFPVEAQGLRLLASAQAVRVPTVHLVAENFLVLAWLGQGASTAAIAATLGEQLAQQHRFTGPHYGLDHHNYCGATPQPNTPSQSWPAFFGEQRLHYQAKLAQKNGLWPARRGLAMEKLLKHLPNLLPAEPPKSLLHGDLWGGNWLVTSTGQPALIDPAVSYGHREADLAFTEVFGGFPAAFYQAYRSAWPLMAGYEERKHIYNLYHLLNHLNLFGESYGGQVDAMLNKFR